MEFLIFCLLYECMILFIKWFKDNIKYIFLSMMRKKERVIKGDNCI